MVERFFKLKEHNTTIKTEVIAGFTTFLSMVYILAVNPTILSSAGMEPAAVFTATVVSAVAATAFMVFFANYPIALASGMGLNAYFAFSVCLPLAKVGIQDPWKIALTAVLVEGIIFVILSFFKFRETLVNKIPENLKYGITAGIGLFIAFVGMQGAKIIVKNDATLVDLGVMNQPQVVLALVGLLLIGVLYHFRVVGFMLWGILITWGLGMLAQELGWYAVDPDAGMHSLFPNFEGGLVPAVPNFLAFNFEYVTKHFLEFAVIVFSFLFVDLFDTAGALVGIAAKADLLDEEGNLPKAGAALMSDALGTIVGACLGTSTVTTYIESSAGVANGGRTGLTALTTAGLFILALFFSPIFLAVPAFATTPALIFVGLLMMSAVKKMDFESDMAAAMGGLIEILWQKCRLMMVSGRTKPDFLPKFQVG